MIIPWIDTVVHMSEQLRLVENLRTADRELEETGERIRKAHDTNLRLSVLGKYSFDHTQAIERVKECEKALLAHVRKAAR